MVSLYRYALGREAVLTPREYTFVVPLGGPRLQLNEKLRLFVTPHKFDKSPEAAQFTALNYLPGYRRSYDLSDPRWKFEDNLGWEVHDASAIPPHSRAWPAFGRTGGGFELVLDYAGPRWPRLAPSHEVLLGDGVDFSPFEQDIVEPLDRELALTIANNAVSALVRTEVGNRERRIAGKVSPSGVVVVAGGGGRQYSVSTAWRIVGMDVEIMLWTYSWRDSGASPVRRLFGPHIGGWHFHSVAPKATPREDVQRLFAEKATSLSSRIGVRLDDAISQVVSRVVEPSEEYLEAHSASTVLP